MYYISILEKNLKNNYDYVFLFYIEFLRFFRIRFGVIFIKGVGFEGVFFNEVGSDCVFDVFFIDGVFGEGGGILRVGDKVIIG